MNRLAQALGLAIATLACNGAAHAATYVVTANSTSFDNQLASRVEAAGGRIVARLPQIGVAIVESDNPAFGTTAGRIPAVRSAVADVAIQYDLPAAAEEVTADYANPPVFITENGAGFGDRDEMVEGSIVKDPLRTDYVRRHVEATLKARREGADIRGYMAWSLFDNFEWIQGFTRRFGMVWVDFETQRRIPKQSFYAYRDLIAAFRRQAAA